LNTIAANLDSIIVARVAWINSLSEEEKTALKVE
jgi:hypothetical protein